MAMANLKRCLPVPVVLGIACVAGCADDMTEPALARPSRGPEFVLLAPGTVAQVSAGADYGCALRTDGTVACWGDNYFGQATPPADAFTEVSAGGPGGAATPTGRYTIINKDKTKRRVSEPDAGYPMAYWCEFAPAYGFHEGFIWSSPRTHGCVRLHREAAARLYALVRIGTPVDIESSFAEDEKYAKDVVRIDQSKDPNPPRSELMSSNWFKDPPGPLLIDQ